jgi:hypothetical protein
MIMVMMIVMMMMMMMNDDDDEGICITCFEVYTKVFIQLLLFSGATVHLETWPLLNSRHSMYLTLPSSRCCTVSNAFVLRLIWLNYKDALSLQREMNLE